MRALVAGALMALLLAGCSGADQPAADDDTRAASTVAVDTPALRKEKVAAGIDPCDAGTDPSAVDGGLPDVTLPCLGGGPDIDLASVRGPAVVNVWASWCGPCRDELPLFAQLHDSGGGEVAVLGVDFEDPSPGAALDLAQKSGVTYPLVADPDAATKAGLGIIGLPQTMFVDAEGVVVATERAPVTSYDQLAGLVKEHLGVDL